MTLRLLWALLLVLCVAACSGDDAPSPGDAGTTPDAHVPPGDAGADAAPLPDGGGRDSGGSDAGAPDAGGPSDFHVTTGDCVLVWQRTGVGEGERIWTVESYPDVTGDSRADLLTVSGGADETVVEIRRGTDGCAK